MWILQAAEEKPGTKCVLSLDSKCLPPTKKERGIKMAAVVQVGNRSGKYASQKTVTFQDLGPLIRTGFISQDEKKQNRTTTGNNMQRK